MDVVSAIIFGIAQGITEWLPISSSGHLAILQQIMKTDASPEFFTVLNLGTILAITFYLKQDLIDLTKGIIKNNEKSIELLKKIIVAGIPTAIIGFSLKEFFKSIFSNVALLSVGFVITSFFLFLSKRIRLRKQNNLDYVSAFIMGVAQAIAIAPGVSRSGTTISSGLMFGVKKEQALKFSFLIGLPAQTIASILELKQAIVFNQSIFIYSLGIIFSAIFGFLSIKFLIQVLKKDVFYLFAYYCLALGIIGFLLFHI